MMASDGSCDREISNVVSNGYHTIESKIEGSQNSNSNIKHEDKNKSYLRVWIAVSVSCICYVVSYLSLSPLSIQYFSERIAKDDYNLTYRSKSGQCDNASDEMEDLMDKVQQDASLVLIYSGVASGIPALFTSLIVGSYSDYIGRKPILVASMCGGFVRLLILTLVIQFEWDLRMYYVGAAIDGLLGSYFTLILATTAIIADITPDAKNRGLNFAIIEGLLLPTAALAQIGIGFLIKGGFVLPSSIICGLLLIGLAVNLFLLPETVRWKRGFTWDPRIHVKKVFGFYFFNNSVKKRLLYGFALIPFTVISLSNIGKSSVETLYELAYPVCMTSVDIGMYLAIRTVGTAFITVVFLRLVKNRVSLEYAGIVCAISGAAGFIMFGLSKTVAELYLAALVGGLFFGTIPIPRALLSQMTPATEQGALFSSLSVMDCISSLVSSVLFTYMYNATTNSFKGTVFMILGGLTVVNGIFLFVFRKVRGSSSLCDYTYMNQEITIPQENGSPLHSPTTPVDESSKLLDSQ